MRRIIGRQALLGHHNGGSRSTAGRVEDRKGANRAAVGQHR
jgi:hypothetical protein